MKIKPLYTQVTVIEITSRIIIGLTELKLK